MAIAIEVSAMPATVWSGDLEHAIEQAEKLVEWAGEIGAEFDLIATRQAQAFAMSWVGRADETASFLERVVASGREATRGDHAVMSFSAGAVVQAALGEDESATALIEELIDTPEVGVGELTLTLTPLVRAAISIGRPDLGERLVELLTIGLPLAEHALVASGATLAEARGDVAAAGEGYADAASRWEAFGFAPEQGFALLGQGRCLLALGRPSEAADVLQRTREIFVKCGMQPAIAETDEALAEATALSS
jgi:tetratricopeptide (TPR) repeat protein